MSDQNKDLIGTIRDGSRDGMGRIGASLALASLAFGEMSFRSRVPKDRMGRKLARTRTKKELAKITRNRAARKARRTTRSAR